MLLSGTLKRRRVSPFPKHLVLPLSPAPLHRSSLRSALVWSQIYSGTHKDVTLAVLRGGKCAVWETWEFTRSDFFSGRRLNWLFKEVDTEEMEDLWFYIHCESMNMFHSWRVDIWLRTKLRNYCRLWGVTEMWWSRNYFRCSRFQLHPFLSLTV